MAVKSNEESIPCDESIELEAAFLEVIVNLRPRIQRVYKTLTEMLLVKEPMETKLLGSDLLIQPEGKLRIVVNEVVVDHTRVMRKDI